jgi:large subunit ribosomal protein L18
VTIGKMTAQKKRQRRHLRSRQKISGSGQRPRVAVFKSNRYLYVQAIDDEKRITLATASTKEKNWAFEKTKGLQAAALLGGIFAARILEKGINKVVFDRGGFMYHGQVASIADAMREKGLEF